MKFEELIDTGILGKKTAYTEHYAPDLLFPISRSLGRNKIGLDSKQLPFEGEDIWNGFEISWLNKKGKPQIAMAEFRFPCDSPFIIESKSFKLYLNSFNQSTFENLDFVKLTLEKDLSKFAGTPIFVDLYSPSEMKETDLSQFSGICLDHLDIETDCYELNTDFLQTETTDTEESLYSDLLKSNCLATGQPDWGSLFIHYCGPKIDHEGLLKYIISFRRHAGFAEHCVEQIYQDILTKCHPDKLTVYVRYTRRGGLDINPFRTNEKFILNNDRHFRQ